MIKLRVSRSEHDDKCYHLTLDVVQDPEDTSVRGAGGKLVLEVAKTEFPFKPELGEEVEFDLGRAFAWTREHLAAIKAEEDRQTAMAAARAEQEQAEAARQNEALAAERAEEERHARVKAAQAELDEAEAALDPAARVALAKRRLADAEAAGG